MRISNRVHELFTREEWFSLPLKLRVRWWDETDYSKRAPSPELVAEINKALGR